MPWLSWLVAWLSLQWFGLNPKPDHVGFVVEEVALGKVFLRVLQILPACVILPMLHTHSVVYHQCCIIFCSRVSLNDTLKEKEKPVGSKSRSYAVTDECSWPIILAIPSCQVECTKYWGIASVKWSIVAVQYYAFEFVVKSIMYLFCFFPPHNLPMYAKT